MNPRLKELLDHLSTTLTSERESEIEERHHRALSWEPVDRLPLVLSYPAPSGKFQPYLHSQTLEDPEKMLFNELVSTYGTSIVHRELVGDDLPCTLRANFGCGIVASLFGAHIEQVEENPPWVHPHGTPEQCWEAIERDPLDFTRGWAPRVKERYAFYREILAGRPELSAVIKLVLPDLQGPMDTLEMLRGSDVFLDFCTDPDRVRAALETLAAAQIGFARHLALWLTDGPQGWSHQHGFTIPGCILVRVDTAIMLSPQMYREQVKPHDERVLRELGGGGLHSCGKVDHLASEFLTLASGRCLDLGQPLLNDMDALYRLAREHRVPLLRVSVSEAELTSGAVFRRFPTGVSLLHAASSVDEARRIMAAYRRSAEHRAEHIA
jgi:hypothetical protein